jgi:hypothetical protein
MGFLTPTSLACGALLFVFFQSLENQSITFPSLGKAAIPCYFPTMKTVVIVLDSVGIGAAHLPAK